MSAGGRATPGAPPFCRTRSHALRTLAGASIRSIRLSLKAGCIITAAAELPGSEAPLRGCYDSSLLKMFGPSPSQATGTMASADSCPVTGYVATSGAPSMAHAGQASPNKDMYSPQKPPHLPTSVSHRASACSAASPQSPAFYAVRVPRLLSLPYRLPSDPSSRRRPCRWLVVPPLLY